MLKNTYTSIYTSGEYAAKHPTWHVEDSLWKSKLIMRIMVQNHIEPQTICEVGCGAGEILKQLQMHMSDVCEFFGYEISPQAFTLCKSKESDKLHFKLADIMQEKDTEFDLILLIDLIEHMDDYFSFLREIRTKSRYKILKIPLEITLPSVLNDSLFIKAREDYGHIHHFTQKIALQMLRDLGYEVIDNFYAQVPYIGLKGLFRKLFFAIHRDLAVRVLGNYHLLVLAK